MKLFYTEGGFFRALEKGDIKTVAAYLARDKQHWLHDVRKDTGGQYDALEWAISYRQPEMVAYLLEQGADPNRNNKINGTPMTVAGWGGRIPLLEVLIKHGGEADRALYAMCNAYVTRESVDWLLKKGKANPNKYPCLKAALAWRHPDTAVSLIEAGGVCDFVDDGVPPLHYAIKMEYTNVIDALLVNGMDVNVRDPNGQTALHHAVYMCKSNMISLLLAHGADPTIRDNAGHTPIDLAKTHFSRALPMLEKEEKKHVKDMETWVPVGQDKIAHIGVYPALGQKISHVFNFISCERQTIVENLATSVQSVSPAEKFCDLDETVVAAAYEAFKKAGGKASEERVFKGHLRKTSLRIGGD